MQPSGTVGVIMLDTRFPRFVGDIGSQDTWPFDVVFEVVRGARASDVVNSTGEQKLQPFIDAAIKLQSKGVSGITTSCGFLSMVQADIAEHLHIPFVASSLIQVPWVQSTLPPGKRVGILTIDSNALTALHLQAAGIDTDIPVAGVQHGLEFTQAILNDRLAMSKNQCEHDNVEAALQFVSAHPDLGAIVLECTNMAPYASAIQRATGLPVFSIYTLICWLQSGLLSRQF